MPLSPLPIDAVLPDLIAHLRDHSCVVLRAPTGSGKTTRVPPAILDACITPPQEVIVLEPRRVAARAAARRIAEERGSPLGQEIGFQVRFEQQVSSRTRLKVVTDGILLRMLQDDPFLERVGAVVFDEFHERGLNVDLALAMVRRVQQTVRPDLKIIVMSATLDVSAVASYLGGAPAVLAEGRLFPVDITYWNDLRPGSTSGTAVNFANLSAAVEFACDKSPGDLLVFLPGVGEIRRAEDELQSLALQRQLKVMPLYGDLPGDQQDAVLKRASSRKLVLATNVAETSITIDGITAVIDTGLARRQQFEPAVGLDRLVLGRISQASAEQRAGRAGRQQPGICVRLWSERDQRGLAEQEEPEIRRVDLAGPVLELWAWGETNVESFPWFEPPRPEAVEHAANLLTQLGARRDRQVTPLGQQMARLPVHPRLARLLLAGQFWGIPNRAALAAALLSERDPFLREQHDFTRGPRRARHRSESDLLDRVVALEEFESNGTLFSEVGRLNPGTARHLLKIRDQLQRLLRDTLSHSVGEGGRRPGEGERSPSSPRQSPPGNDHHINADEALLRAVLDAFPDRLARRREATPGVSGTIPVPSRRGVMVGGRGVKLWDTSAVSDAELFVCVDVDAGSGEALVRQASAVSRDWLPTQFLTTTVDVEFDARTDRVSAIRRTRWNGLILDESPAPLPEGQQVADALARAGLSDFDRVFPRDNAELNNYIARVNSLRHWMPDLELPLLDDEQLQKLLPDVCRGCRSFADVRRGPWVHVIKNLMPYQQQQAVEREAPERLEVPSGNHITLHYETGRSPVLAVRIQEMFGLAETPRIASGRIPVLLHLLAPNYRPQQVTDDLRSFWNNAYQQVRKELRRRYPKHAWPEDPWQAAPEKRPQRRAH